MLIFLVGKSHAPLLYTFTSVRGTHPTLAIYVEIQKLNSKLILENWLNGKSQNIQTFKF
jgi:hypothetical protein